MTGRPWRFSVLGPITLEFNGAEVQIAGRQPRTLLALLLMNRGRPLTVEALADQLWGGELPASARSALHVYLSKLRALPGDLLVRSAAGYALDANAYELDADAFDRLVDLARQNPARTRALLAEALGLWRGDPLSDIAPDGVLAEWRQSLEERRLRATVIRIDCDLADGAGGGLVAELEQLIAANSYEERLWEQLLHALYRGGRRAEALDAYQRARKLYASELGLDPGEQLRRIHEQILEQDPSLLPTTNPALATPVQETSPPPRPPAGRELALPRPTTRLIGRDVALLELEGLASDPFCRLITLTGIGGVGKTRLAIAHAARWGEAFADGVAFVGLARLTDAQQVRAEIAAAIARRSSSAEPNELSLISYLRDRDLLLVIDNFEHVLDAAGLVAELLQETPALKVLVTSRVPLRIRGEQRFEVEPLPTDVAGDPTGGPAVELFVQGARALDRTFKPAPSELVTVAGICSALDGLPLAIELAAARSGTLPLTAIAAQLSEPLSVGGGALRDLPDRHQTLEAAIRWSYDLLSEPAQHALRAASVFRGPFTPDGLSAVMATTCSAELEELREASLVKQSSVPGRFRLLELVRAFARARLVEAGSEAPARARHRAYLVERFADVAADEHPTDPGQVALAMAADHADIRAAIRSAVAAGDRAAAVTLTRSLQPIWMAGQLEEAGPIVDQVLDAFTISPDDELYLLRMASFANSYRPTNKYWARRRVTRAGELGQVSPQVSGLSNMIAQALCRQDVVEALELRSQLMPVFETAELKPRVRAAALSMLSGCAYAQGDYAAAVRYGEESFTAAAADGHPHMLTVARAMLLSAASAHRRSIGREELLELVEGALGLQISDLAISSLWASARYSVGFEPERARSWLVHGERLLTEIGGELWPESQWRDETLRALGLREITPLMASVPPQATAAVLTEARDWLAARAPGERAPRAELEPALVTLRAAPG